MGDVPVKVIQIKFRQKWRDNLLRISTRLLTGVKIPRRLIKAMLRWAMEGSSAAEALGAGHFDAVLSTGSSVAAPNLLLGQLVGAKTAVCTRPSPVGINRFNLAILPEHMKPRRPADNAVISIGVPNRITPESVMSAGKDLATKLGTTGQRVIGLLLGGDDRHYSISPNMVLALCDALLGICKESDFRIALTTSRRTNPEAEDVVRAKLHGDPRCCYSVLASEPQQENPVPGILGISDVIIVTEDSFSMVCEAASSGKKIVVMEVERKKQGYPKRQRVYQLLMQRGYIKRASILNLRGVVFSFADDPSTPKALDDAQTAADALRALIGER
jgi:mitochondrial fission protein ELM1